MRKIGLNQHKLLLCLPRNGGRRRSNLPVL